MEDAASVLTAHGANITSRWVYGGEEGKTNQDIAVFDIEDLEKAECVVSFTEPYGTMYKGGGRCVEFGYGLAKGKYLILIGERENVFHWYPGVQRFNTLEDFIASYS